ncbi:MAG: sulfotransferase [Acidobacteria bacterium]|nr:sulfotransferase [Acidobacteriota bacterium]
MASGHRTRLAYILAPSHSGSTLLALLLGSHPDVTTIGEVNVSALDDPATYLCSCGEPLRNCPFWEVITRCMDRRGFAFDIAAPGTDFQRVSSGYAKALLRPLHRGALLEWCRETALRLSPAWRAAYGAIQARNAALVQSICEVNGAQVVVDSSKIGLRLKYLLRNADLDVRVIRLVRDGRAVAVSYVDPERFADACEQSLRGGGSGRSREAERLDMEAAAREWRRSNEEADLLLARLPPSRWIEVRYESICRDTEATLRRIFRFLEVDPVRPRPPFRDATTHVIGNGMRLDTTSDVRLDTRWRVVFSEGDRRLFDAVAGRLNRRLGYAEEAGGGARRPRAWPQRTRPPRRRRRSTCVSSRTTHSRP